jgi:two-component system, chemotaxis family, CheB/CheR fusion protein
MPTPDFELRRQIRGLFALLRALIRRGAEEFDSVEDYAAHLETRVESLSRVQEVLLRDPTAGADLEELVRDELVSQAIAENTYTVKGPEVRLAVATAAPLALAIHELLLNAITHGALAESGGRARIEWKVRRHAGNEWLCIRWNESGRALLDAAPLRKGFGMDLLERMLPYELSARTLFGFHKSGARVLIMIPRFCGTRPAAWSAESRLRLVAKTRDEHVRDG